MQAKLGITTNHTTLTICNDLLQLQNQLYNEDHLHGLHGQGAGQVGGRGQCDHQDGLQSKPERNKLFCRAGRQNQISGWCYLAC